MKRIKLPKEKWWNGGSVSCPSDECQRLNASLMYVKKGIPSPQIALFPVRDRVTELTFSKGSYI